MNTELYKRTIATWGVAKQMEMVVEECSELILSIQKYKRDGSSEKIKDMIGEVADVEIMVEQMREMFGNLKVDEAKALKLARLEMRLDNYDVKNAQTVHEVQVEEDRQHQMIKLMIADKCYCHLTKEGSKCIIHCWDGGDR